MTQIIYKADSATSVAAGAVLTTGFVHPLPQWAPPIEYIGTTDPWHVLFLLGSTLTVAEILRSKGTIKTGKVRAYGRRATLEGGRECFSSDITVGQQYVTVNGPAQTGRPSCMYVLTYRAVGELTRP